VIAVREGVAQSSARRIVVVTASVERRGAMAETGLDEVRVDRFAAHLFDVLNHSGEALLMSMGHKTGLIKAMIGLAPSTSAEIADGAGLNERYVREWLAGMAVSRIVEYDPVAKTYSLPAEHGVVLSAADASGMAGHAQFIAVLASLEPRIAEYFRNGGGLPYSALEGLDWGVLVGETDWDEWLLESALPLAPGLVDRLRTGIEVADIGCGYGHKLNVMGKAFPHSRFVGYDIASGSLEVARKESEEMGLSNVAFELEDAAELHVVEGFDLVLAFDAIHDQRAPRAVLAAIYEALRPGGTLFMADITAASSLHDNIEHPLGAYLYAWSLCHCMTLSLGQGGEGLGAMWGEQQALEYLSAAGFADVAVKRVERDPVNNYYICAKH